MRRALGLLFIATIATIALGACGDDDPGIDETGVGHAANAASTDTTDSGSGGAVADPESVSCAAGDEGTVTIDIEDFQFQPSEITVAAGESVTWVNQDSAPHAVWSEERSTGERAWQSVGGDPMARAPENLAADEASTCTFPAPGTYAYLCGIHNTMVGSIVVT
jgi:plastocyanin